jgi:effector-binding domain-containing protein
MTYDIKIKDLPTQNTLTVRTRSPVQNLPQVLGEAYGAIMAYIGELGESPVGAPFVIYYNLDMQDLDIEVGFPVSKKFPDKDKVNASEIAAGKFATTLHIGPYDKAELAYNELNQWIQENGYESKDSAIELYFNDPQEVGIENAQTEIQIPLK